MLIHNFVFLISLLIFVYQQIDISDYYWEKILKLIYVLVIVNLFFILLTHLLGPEEYMKLLTGRYRWANDTEYKFKISSSEAESLRGFSIEPILNENDIISGYNKLVLSVDTLAIKDYPILEFKKTFTDYDYELHEIKITSTQNKIFKKLDSVILSSITNNDFFKKIINFFYDERIEIFLLVSC